MSVRFTLRQLMIVVAVSAVYFAAMTSSLAGHYTYLFIISYATTLAGAGVLLFNVRLSGWMWVALAGFVGPMLLGILMSVAQATTPISLNGHILVTVHVALNCVCSLVFVVGLAETFRDIRRRLTSREAPTDGLDDQRLPEPAEPVGSDPCPPSHPGPECLPP